jgi:4-diphosphocytidyl-2C-methyl-D-erythritol kinase
MAVPEFAVNTGWVFAQLEANPCEAGASGIASEGALLLPALPTENDLLNAAEKAYPQLQEFHAKLDAAADFQLSGSGGTFFAFFPDFEAAEKCAEHTREICSQVFVAPLQHDSILRAPIAIPTAGSST